MVPLLMDIDCRTNGASRRREDADKATDVPVAPAPQTKGIGIRARHLLFDSWFAFPVTILRRLLAKGMPYYLHAQAMVDRTSFTIFLQKQFMVDPSHQSFPLKFDLRSRFGDGGSFE